MAVISTPVSSSLLIHSSESLSPLLIPSIVSFISVIAFFNSVSLFFVFSNSFLKVYNFLLSASVLLPSPLIVFTIITLNCFLGRLPTSTSLSCSYEVLSCSFVSNIFLCHLILSQVLFVFYVCGRLVTFLDFGEVFLCKTSFASQQCSPNNGQGPGSPRVVSGLNLQIILWVAEQ